MKRLEEEFNLPSIDEVQEEEAKPDEKTIEEYKEVMTVCDKIDNALREVKGMEVHDSEMDDIATDAQEAFKQLMALGYNMTDMAAGPVFSNAVSMLDIARKAKDSKVSRKLKQIDLMLKKANLDARIEKENRNNGDDGDAETVNSTTFDRNEILKILNGGSDNS